MHEDEQPEFLIESGTVERDRGHRTDDLTPPADTQAVVAITDRRIVVLAPQSTTRPERDERFPIHFADVSRVGLDDTNDPGVVAVAHEHGHRWRIAVESVALDRVTAAVSYARTGAEVWTRAQEAASAVHAGRRDLVEPVRNGGDWQSVTERYDALDERIAAARACAEGTPFEDTASLRETLDRAARTLETAYCRALFVRLTEATTAAHERLDDADAEGALDQFGVAAESYRAVVERVEEMDLDPVAAGQSVAAASEHERTPLAAADTESALSVAADRVAEVGRAVVKRAADARADAAATDDTDATVTALQRAFDTYRALLDHAWGTPTLLGVERERLQTLVEETVESLIEVRREAAETAQWEANEALAEDEQVRAARLFDEAIEYLDPALPLASEYRAGDRESIEALLERLREDRSGLQAGAALKA